MSEHRTQFLLATLRLAPVVPVITVDSAEVAVAMAHALVAGGLPVLEVTLRTDGALDAIEAIARHVPGAVVGAGTVLTPSQVDEAVSAGAKFLVSPGATRKLAEAAAAGPAPLPHLTFCPTGGIDAAKAPSYLSLSNVICVGGSWVTPAAAVKSGDWATVTRLAHEASKLAG